MLEGGTCRTASGLSLGAVLDELLLLEEVPGSEKEDEGGVGGSEVPFCWA